MRVPGLQAQQPQAWEPASCTRRAREGGGRTLQHGDDEVEVVAVDGADVVQAELLEQRGAAPADHAARVLVDLCRRLLRAHTSAQPCQRRAWAGRPCRASLSTLHKVGDGLRHCLMYTVTNLCACTACKLKVH